MTISYHEQSELTCPHCGADFEADVWLLLDAQEQPDAVELLLRGELNTVLCPHCSAGGPAGAPLLYHDGVARQVVFVAAPGAAEHELREQARDLHALLVGSIPAELRRPYLADVEIAHDLAGMSRLVTRRNAQRARRGGADVAAPASQATPASPQSAEPLSPDPLDAEPGAGSPLLAAVEALLSADTPDQLQAVLAHYPLLLEPASDAALAELAEVAANQGEHAIAEGLMNARFLLTRTRTALESQQAPLPEQQGVREPLADAAWVALLQVGSAADLDEAVRRFPALLHTEIDGLLAEAVEQALDEGNERLASDLELRREALTVLRSRGENPADDELDYTLDEAIEALLIAEGEAAIAAVVAHYPLLLDDVAAQALVQFASEARNSDDEEMARYALECRDLLRRMRDA